MGDAQVIGKEPCPSCGSSDNLVRYDDGSAWCFTPGCERYEKPSGEAGENTGFQTKKSGGKAAIQIEGEIESLPKRKIWEDTCKLWGYRVGEFMGKRAHYAYYFDPVTRKPVAAKVRFPNKDFTIIGDFNAAPLYGQWLWAAGGRKIVVTEGEIDALSVSQVQQNKWPVVSIPNGAQGAKKALKKAYDYLVSFDEIILMFDMDEHGRHAAVECAELFPPGKVKIADLPMKDASDMLQADRGDEVVRSIWNAKTYRPDGIVDGMSLWQEVVEDHDTYSIPYPWEGLNDRTHGLRSGELVTVTAGSGVGKSAVVREIAYHLLQRAENVGLIMLEESVKRTALGLMGIAINRPLHISKEGVSEAELKAAFDATVGSGRCFLYDHFGSTEVDNLLSRIRYMAKSLDCKWIILDHLSIVVSGLDEGGDERKLIDRTMTMLRTLVEETGLGLIIVSHLKRPDGKGHEEGAKTSLNQLRGSHAIAQLSDMVLGLERNQQDDDNPNQTTVRVLKNRFSGETGEAATLYYNRETGRLSDQPFEDETEETAF
jgi:twinkle protein